MTDKEHLNRPILKSDEQKVTTNSANIDTDVQENSQIANINNSETNTSPIQQKATKKRIFNDEEYQEILSYMQKHFPNSFPIGIAPLPLAVGIHNQIFTIPDFPFSKMKIRKFLKVYTRKRDYRKGLIVDNSRFNLDSTLASKILPEETNWLVWKEVRAERRDERAKS